MRTAERAHRPGSRRLGGVEATGASVATAGSWPDRRKGWASPEWGPALRLAVMGGMGPGRGALTSPVPQIARLGRRLFWYRRKSTASTTGFYIPGRRGAPLAGVSRSTKISTMHKRSLPPSRPGVGISARVLFPPPERVPIMCALQQMKAARSATKFRPT